MGPSISTENFYQFAVQLGQFNNISISPDEEFMMSTVIVHGSNQLRNWKLSLIQLNRLNPQHMLLPLQYRKQIARGIIQYRQIVYNCYPINLQKQIQKRIKLQQYHQQKEIWYLLYCLVSSASISNKVQSRLGDIRLMNILLNKQGKINIFNKLSIPSFRDPYYQPNLMECILAPQQLLNAKQGRMQNDCDSLLAQTFSIGLICLCIAMLCDPRCIYEFNIFKIDQYKLQHLKQQFSNLSTFKLQLGKQISYSPSLKQIILSMTEIRPQKRLKCSDIEQILNPYMQNILNQVDFKIQQSRINKQTHKRKQSINRSTIHHLKSKKSQLYAQQQLPPPTLQIKHFSFMQQPNQQLQIEKHFSFMSPNNIISSTNSSKKKQKIKTYAKLTTKNNKQQ